MERWGGGGGGARLLKIWQSRGVDGEGEKGGGGWRLGGGGEGEITKLSEEADSVVAVLSSRSYAVYQVQLLYRYDWYPHE